MTIQLEGCVFSEESFCQLPWLLMSYGLQTEVAENTCNGQSFNQSRDQDYRPATLADGPYQKTYSHDPAGIKGARLDLFPYPL
jgi:hypothetical protein